MKIYCIGIGPGGEEQMTLRAVRALEACDCVAGYGLYLDLIDSLIEGKERIQTGMTREVDRCAAALERAKQGRTVAVVSSGDAGVYGMAGLLIELAAGTGVEVEVIPGITATCSGGAVLGSPLTCDFACISLSDLLTPWDKIEQRLRGAIEAAIGDFLRAGKQRREHLVAETFAVHVAARLGKPLRRTLKRLQKEIIHMQDGHAQFPAKARGQRRLARGAHAVDGGDALFQRAKRGNERRQFLLRLPAGKPGHSALSSTSAVRQGRYTRKPAESPSGSEV